MSAIEIIRAQTRVFSAIFFRELYSKLGRSGFAFLLSLMEPIFHIAVVCSWHYLVRIIPVYGNSKVLFISTGLYPVFVFIHLSSQYEGAIARGRFPVERTLDIFFAQTLLKLFGYLLVGVLLFSGISVFITPQGIPYDFEPVMLSILTLGTLGMGVGLCNVVISVHYPMWRHIYAPISRCLILFSGVLFVPDFMPLVLRKYLAWNPVMHGVDLFRQGFYPGYPRLIFDPQFLWFCALAALVLGLSLERISRSRIERR